MADKPKTYPQQIQELKEQLEVKDQALNEALQRLSFVEEMQEEIAHLRERLEQAEKANQQSGVSSKAQWTDLEQRATSAEQGLRNAQAKITELETIRQALESQLNVAAIERDRNVGRADKVTALTEQFKAERLGFAQREQRILEQYRELETAKADLEKQRNYYAGQAAKYSQELLALRHEIQSMPDVISLLKQMVR